MYPSCVRSHPHYSLFPSFCSVIAHKGFGVLFLFVHIINIFVLTFSFSFRYNNYLCFTKSRNDTGMQPPAFWLCIRKGGVVGLSYHNFLYHSMGLALFPGSQFGTLFSQSVCATLSTREGADPWAMHGEM